MTDNEVARQDEVLAALTRILRREATESAIVSTRSRVPTLCADGKVRYAERTETRVVEIPPKISDVNRAAICWAGAVACGPSGRRRPGPMCALWTM